MTNVPSLQAFLLKLLKSSRVIVLTDDIKMCWSLENLLSEFKFGETVVTYSHQSTLPSLAYDFVRFAVFLILAKTPGIL